MEKIEISFDFATPSQNKLKNWKALMGWGKKFDKYLSNYFLVKKYNANEKRSVLITRYSKKELDFGNFVGGCKPLLDALKRAKLIIDDSTVWLEDDYIQKKGKPKTEVILTWSDKRIIGK